MKVNVWVDQVMVNQHITSEQTNYLVIDPQFPKVFPRKSNIKHRFVYPFIKYTSEEINISNIECLQIETVISGLETHVMMLSFHFDYH